MNSKKNNLLESGLIKSAFWDSIKKMNPAIQIRNPVMFIVYLGSVISTLILTKNFITKTSIELAGFNFQITLWLWFTVIFANFAEAVAEGRGKARADSLKKARTDTLARLLQDAQSRKFTLAAAISLKKGDLVLCEAGDFIPTDGEIVEGMATIDESAITGESAPVVRESGGDRSAVTGGTRVISDSIIVRITAEQGNTFLDKMISLVEGAKRQKTPNEIALTILLSAMSIIFIFAVVSLYPFAEYSYRAAGQNNDITVIVLISLLVCLIPTTIAGLLSAIGISGMDRLLQSNVIAMSGKAVEAAGDIDTLLLDKTGTITLGSRMASGLIPARGVNIKRLVSAAQLASLADETPEGRSIVVYAKEKYGLRERNLHELGGVFVRFSAKTRMSGVDFPKGKPIRKGAVDAVRRFVEAQGGTFPTDVNLMVDSVSREGATPLVVCEGAEILGMIELRDIIKGGIKERFDRLRKMGIKTIMITGDNPLTAAAIAASAGVDDFIAEATPETKLQKIRDEQQGGRLIAMIGDGTNDAPALAQADVGVAMNTGTQVAREAGNMIDLDSNPTKLIEIVEIGKRLLMTRGSLTTFSIANDVAKYFAIIPALFGTLYATRGTSGPLSYLNIMGLHSPQSAILSAVIFNALIIIALIPLALRGVAYKPMGADKVLVRNLLIYGIGGLIVPFVGIKIIDVILTGLHLI